MTAGNLSVHLTQARGRRLRRDHEDPPGPHPGHLRRAHPARPARLRGLHRTAIRALLDSAPGGALHDLLARAVEVTRRYGDVLALDHVSPRHQGR